jgi:hypothetical protein
VFVALRAIETVDFLTVQWRIHGRMADETVPVRHCHLMRDV